MTGLAAGKAPRARTLKEFRGFAMSTYFRVTLPDELNHEQVSEITRELQTMESLFNRYEATSEISRINRQAGEWVEVSGTTAGLLARSLDMAGRTGGAFDPTVGPLVDLWAIYPWSGEDQDDGGWVPPAPPDIRQAVTLVGYPMLQLSPGENKVRLKIPGMSLDLGGVAKGYAVDRVVKLLRSYGVTSGMVDLGGNIFALGEHPEGRPWSLGIRHPRDPDRTTAVVQVADRAVATSGDYQRYRMYQGERFSHLINPATGWPARDVVSVTIVAPEGIVADALSTAVFILGKERGCALIEEWPGVEGVVIGPDLRVWYSSGLLGKIALR
ncbi:hypothetical protein SY88_17995 [Clostridiales bacterium PH28_bin88]|nr:hypothetical protein SY88_17995 [Clostridiales bacterium PH28_bin88]